MVLLIVHKGGNLQYLYALISNIKSLHISAQNTFIQVSLKPGLEYTNLFCFQGSGGLVFRALDQHPVDPGFVSSIRRFNMINSCSFTKCLVLAV